MSAFRATGGIVSIGVDNTAGTLSLGTAFATNVSVGTTAVGTTTVNNALTATGLTTANGGLTMGSTKNITLQPNAGYVAPTVDIMLGGRTVGTFSTPASSFSAAKDIATITVDKGMYIIFFTFQAQYTVLPTEYFVQFNTSGSTAAVLPSNFRIGGTVIAAGALGFMGSIPLSITTGGTIVLRFFPTGTITSIVLPTYTAVRIA